MKHKFSFKLLAVIALSFVSQFGFTQVTTQPSPALELQGVKILFDASMGSGGLKDYSGDIYAHIGVITNLSTGGGDWKYVKADWAVNKPECKLTKVSGNTYSLELTPSIRSFFGVPAGEQIKQIALVFRSADGSKTGKTASGGDIFVDVFANAIALKISSPADGATFMVGEPVSISASASAASMELYVDNSLVKTASSSSIAYTLTPDSPKEYSIKVIAKDGAGLTEEKTLSINVVKAPTVEDLPIGAKLGLNIVDGKAIFVLEAPGKKFCTLLGSFNKYVASDAFAMKKTPDGEKFWISVDTLRSNVDYSYQYLVDGKVKVSDPYSTLVLDPWNDKYIEASTYPNLPAYPTGLTSGVVSSFRLNKAPYSWQISSFTPPATNRLNIYELHLRDFLAKHDYKTLTDTIGYFKKLGVNVVELMPINEFEGNNSWGYNPSFYFAADKYYGPAEDLKKFVDECHKAGIAVVIDMVLNHSYGLSPLVQLYYDSATSKVTADNPWYNVDSPNTSYSWGYDFNHESKYTQRFVDAVTAYWMNEFKIDGYRFDFTKGFTQRAGDGWAYDASRIAILKRMNSEIKKVNPNAIVIFEHLADNSEEKELANEGILLWGNINNSSCEAAMGYNEGTKSDLSWASYLKREWTKPGVVAYMESHDEERVTFKQLAYGASNGSYNVKDLKTANQRHAALAAIFLSIPGPKMMWQWQELGYDKSINTCENGTISNDCRTNPKPSFWPYYNSNPENESRLQLKSVFEQMNKLRNTYSAFTTSSFKDSLVGAVKYVKLNDNSMSVLAIANFDVVDRSIKVAVTGSGYYYSHFSKDSLKVENGTLKATLKAGEFHLLTSNRLFVPLKLSITSPAEAATFKVDDVVAISATSSADKSTLYINGEKIASFGASLSYSFVPTKAGIFEIKVVASKDGEEEVRTRTIIVEEKPIVLTIASPSAGQEFFVGDVIPIKVSSNASQVVLYVNSQEVARGISEITYNHTAQKAEELEISAMATTANQNKSEAIKVRVKYKMQPNEYGPNPAAKGSIVKFNVTATAAGSVKLGVYTLNGRQVGTREVPVVEGANLVELDTNALRMNLSGLYVVRIYGCGVDVKEKLVIL